MAKRRSAVRPMNSRIAKLREESVGAEVKISSERARLVTEFYKSGMADGKSEPVRRAMAFKYLMERVSLPIEDGQLIVGLRGTGPQEVPTYPEICTHGPRRFKGLRYKGKHALQGRRGYQKGI
ncbi:pyruvate formate lyase family protein [Acetomicrobium sp.]|uniref:pyruvate formate lyase family protein n=1 Tax=Acetomicrobium sp. TaxID=1872099 RepID=UPI002FCC09BE